MHEQVKLYLIHQIRNFTHYVLTLDMKLRSLEEKAGFSPSQPRWPAGTPVGGQWKPSDGTSRSYHNHQH